MHETQSDDVAALYDRGADSYDGFRELWLRMAGVHAESAMLADLRAVLRPGARVLDAGCGTGALARRMRELQPDIELTLVDLSVGMLARAGDISAQHVQASVLNLPFVDATFDVVVSAWVIETVSDPRQCRPARTPNTAAARDVVSTTAWAARLDRGARAWRTADRCYGSARRRSYGVQGALDADGSPLTRA